MKELLRTAFDDLFAQKMKMIRHEAPRSYRDEWRPSFSSKYVRKGPAFTKVLFKVYRPLAIAKIHQKQEPVVIMCVLKDNTLINASIVDVIILINGDDPRPPHRMIIAA